MADPILYSEGALSLWVGVPIIGRTQLPSAIGSRNCIRLPGVAPWIVAAIIALRCILPFPFMREPLADPCSIGTSVFQRYPRYRLVCPAFRIGALLPITEKIVIVFWMVGRGIHDLLALSIGDWITVHVEGRYLHGVSVIAAWRVLPRILHVDSVPIAALDLDTGHLEVEGTAWNCNHPLGS